MSLHKRLIKELFRFLLIATLVLPVLGAGKASADTTWTQTTQADFQSGTLSQVEATSSPGDVKLAKVGTAGSFVYAFYGSSTNFTRYDITGNSWLSRTATPAAVGAGGSLVYDGSNYVYGFMGSSNTTFWRYSITGNSWATMASANYTIGTGGSLAYDGGNYIYALRGNGTNIFMRYNISANTWTVLANTLNTIGAGGSLVYSNSSYLYALRGGSNNFWRYSIAGNTWTAMATTPNAVGAGASLASDGSNYIYALRGNGQTTFWRYNISGNSWTAMTAAPATVNAGGALAYNSSGNLYAFRGNTTNTFWRYSVSGNSWTAMTNALATVTTGGALAMGGPAYYTSGNLTSSTYDTGYLANFSTLSWTASTPAGTSVKFQVATNSDNATWVFKGPDGTAGTYYTSTGAAIWSGHDGDRYIKYKAFFSTTDAVLTPVLSDVSISFTQVIALPTATTNAATSVEETTATLNGVVANDGGEACLYQFVYGTALGGPYPNSTGWTGSKTTGQSFYADLTGLGKGTKYYFQAQVKNSAGTGTGIELEFLTKPEAPLAGTFTAAVISDTQINLSWTKGDGAQKTMVVRKTGGYPADRNDGAQVYFDTDTSYSDTGLTPDTAYYYRAWSQVSGSEQWSDTYQELNATTASTPLPTPPVVVGGVVFPVNKMQVLAPWLGAFLALLLVVGGALVKLLELRKRA